MTQLLRPAYPMPITGLNGPRWKTSDGVSHATKAQAETAQNLLGPVAMVPVISPWRRAYEAHSFPVGLALVAISLLGILATIGWQIVTWLRVGTWPSDSVLDLFAVPIAGRPHLDWIGADRVLQAIISPPLSLVLLAAAVLIVHLLTRADGIRAGS